ncbi:hypothetical protein [Streptosporangium roseum]|uniref:hypothetical protein n=1 Tax=Streptosporangium roseum TaxID=2001 RepID=UPI00332EE75B
MTAPADSPAPEGADRSLQSPPEPEALTALTWVGEVARMAQHIVESNARTIRACILIAVAAAAWAIFR